MKTMQQIAADCGMDEGQTIMLGMSLAEKGTKDGVDRWDEEWADVIALQYRRIEALETERSKTCQLLLRLEWSKINAWHRLCPVCNQDQKDGHQAGCELVKALGDYSVSKVQAPAPEKPVTDEAVLQVAAILLAAEMSCCEVPADAIPSRRKQALIKDLVDYAHDLINRATEKEGCSKCPVIQGR